MKVKCLYNDPNNLPEKFLSDFNFGLQLEKEYIVTGIMKNGDQISYFIDENGKPNFYPKEIFEVIDAQLSDAWYFREYSMDDVMYNYVQMIFGYYELCFDQNHYEDLVYRDDDALKLYIKRKEEMG